MRRTAATGAILLVATAALGGEPPAAVGAPPAATASPAKDPVRATGLLRAEAEISLRSTIAGLVVATPRLEGDSVQPGEPVVVLDDGDLALQAKEAACDLEAVEIRTRLVKEGMTKEELAKLRAGHEELQATVQLQESSLKTSQSLHDKKLLSDQALRAAERGLEAAKFRLEMARIDLTLAESQPTPERLRMAELELEKSRATEAGKKRDLARARIGGTRPGRAFVGRVHVEVGRWIDAGTIVADLVYMDRLRVDLDLPGAQGLAIAPGTPAIIRSVAYPGLELPARVHRVAPVVDASSGTVRVFVVADNPDLRVKPGVAAEVEIRP